MVGVKGFEPPTPCSQSTCATKLRYTPSGTIVSVFSRALVSSTSCIIQERARFVNRFFTLFCAFFASFFVKRSNHSQYLRYLFISHIHISFCSLHIAFLLHVFCRIPLRVHAFNRLDPFSASVSICIKHDISARMNIFTSSLFVKGYPEIPLHFPLLSCKIDVKIVLCVTKEGIDP